MVYWWDCYGSFSSGKDDLPVFYQVIRHYRELRGMSIKDLAVAYKRSVRFIEMLEKDTNIDMPKSNPRRVALAKILGIPGALLGVSIAGDNGTTTLHPTILENHTQMFYEDMLASTWELYHTSSVSRAAQHIDLWLSFLSQETTKAQGIKKDQLKAVLCRFYQLSALVAREQLDIVRALSDEQEAIILALELGNAELIATSLQRRARIYMQTHKYRLAYQDAIEALPYAERSRDIIKGKTYQMLGESLAHIAGTDKSLQKQSLQYFTTANTLTRIGNLEPDGSFMKLDIASIAIEQAEALTLFGRYDDAHDALAIARDKMSPELTRWLVNILLTEADTLYRQGLYDYSADSALSAFQIIQTLQMKSKEPRVRSLYDLLKNKVPTYKAVKTLSESLKR